MRNKARASMGWLGEFQEKTLSFMEYDEYKSTVGDMSTFARVKERLMCKPFSWYIQRFSYVYLDSGLIPKEIFQIQEEATGFCLARWPKADPRHEGGEAILLPCATEHSGTIELQLWHESNRDRSRPKGPCCSGLNNWNFLQCLNSWGANQKVRTFECDIAGLNGGQVLQLHDRPGDDGQIVWNYGKGTPSLCLAPDGPQLPPEESWSKSIEECTMVVKELSENEFNLRTHGSKFPLDHCLTVIQMEDPIGEDSGWRLRLSACSGSEDQVFTKSAAGDRGGMIVRTAVTRACLDTAGGRELLIYPCYDKKGQPPSANQVWHTVADRLLWEGSKLHCLDVVGSTIGLKSVPVQTAFGLMSCADKVGQRLRKYDQQGDGTFLLKDADSGKCLGEGPEAPTMERQLRLYPCSPSLRWRELKDRAQVQHVATGHCIDAGNEVNPILYPCHTPVAQRKQRWRVTSRPGSVQIMRGWEDNGRKTFFERCIDYAPQPPVAAVMRDCDTTRRGGTRWKRIHAREPREMELWRKAEKPPPDAVPLGGDMAPP